jgi:hypothetical protein
MFVNKLYNKIYYLINKISYVIVSKYLDKGFLELLGPFGFYKLFFIINDYLKNITTSLIMFNVYNILFSLLILLFIILLFQLNIIILFLNNIFIFFIFILLYVFNILL